MRYRSISTGFEQDDAAVDLEVIHWSVDSLIAVVLLEDSAHQVIRIDFDWPTIVRLSTDFHLSTGAEAGNFDGIDERHFAYAVDGSNFQEVNAGEFADLTPVHYRFLTINGCMDVLSMGEPSFTSAPRLDNFPAPDESDE